MTTEPTAIRQDLPWYALATKARQEDRAAENLTAWGVTALAPRIKLSRGVHPKPLFPGYIFARFNIELGIQKIRFTRGVLYVVSFGGRPAEVPGDIILAILSRSDTNGFVTLSSQLQPGPHAGFASRSSRDFDQSLTEGASDGERVKIMLKSIECSCRVDPLASHPSSSEESSASPCQP